MDNSKNQSRLHNLTKAAYDGFTNIHSFYIKGIMSVLDSITPPEDASANFLITKYPIISLNKAERDNMYRCMIRMWITMKINLEFINKPKYLMTGSPIDMTSTLREE